MAFTNCKISNEETAINYLTRLEQKANEARNYDIKISEKKFIWTLLNNMKFHRHYKERIASFLTAFELKPSRISQKWIENKFYSLDEERMTDNRIKSFRESSRFITSNPKQNDMQNSQKKGPHKNLIRCKYYYRSGHLDSKCPDKANKRPPSMPEWISKTTCLKYARRKDTLLSTALL